jgi:hypothetical protein
LESRESPTPETGLLAVRLEVWPYASVDGGISDHIARAVLSAFGHFNPPMDMGALDEDRGSPFSN